MRTIKLKILLITHDDEYIMAKVWVYITDNIERKYDENIDIPIGDFATFDEAYLFILNDIELEILCEESGEFWDGEEKWYRPDENDTIWDEDCVFIPYRDSKNKEIYMKNKKFVIRGEKSYYVFLEC